VSMNPSAGSYPDCDRDVRARRGDTQGTRTMSSVTSLTGISSRSVQRWQHTQGPGSVAGMLQTWQ